MIDQAPIVSRPLMSVIIPTCHRNDLLAKCLEFLAPGAQTLGADDYEVIVTDDSFKTTAEEMIQQQYPWVIWTAGPRRGPAANRNHGARLAQGEWLVFTDDDCLPTLGWLSAYQSAMGNRAPVLEGKTSPTGNRTRVDMECPANETGGYLWSCNFAIKRDLFLEMEGFDENFPAAAMEDVDLRTRLQQSLKEIEFVPTAKVLHEWRLRRGLESQRQHALAVAYYLAKYPEQRLTVGKRAIAANLVRQLLKHLPMPGLKCHGRGLIREAALLIFYSLYLWKVTKSSRGIL